MLEYAPSSGGLALWVHHQDLDDDAPSSRDAALVFTDGHTVFYRPRFGRLPLPEQAGWVAHQVLHIALRHAQRRAELRQRLGDVDAQLFNLCADAIVNSALDPLRWLALPPTAPRLEQVLGAVLGLAGVSPEAALAHWDVERLYQAVDDRRAPSSGRGPAQPQDDGKPLDPRADGPKAARLRALGAGTPLDLRPPGAGLCEPGDPLDHGPEAEAEATRTWGERLQRAHAGDGAYSMLRTLLADLPRVRTPWEQVLRRQAAHALAQRPGLSWSRPTRSWIANQGRAGPGRRLPWEPGSTATRATPRLVVVLDVSGSVDDGLLQRFTREIQALVRRLAAALTLVVGDNTVHTVRHFVPGRADLGPLAGAGFAGDGGTDFTPLLAEAETHRPDLIVVLTDLDGPARHRPRAPVLWAVPEASARMPAPFGRVLVLR